MSELVRRPDSRINVSVSALEVRGARWRLDLVALDRNRVLRGWTRGQLTQRVHEWTRRR